MMQLARIVPALLVLPLALSACVLDDTPSPGDVASEQNEIVGGQLLSADEVARAGLVGLIASTSTSDRTGFCSGTLIGPRLVLTAAHCMATRKGPVRHAAFGADIFAPSRSLVPIQQIVRHRSADLALVLLAEEAPAGFSYATVPGPLRTSLSGTNVTVMGFGRRSAGDAQSGGPAQTLRARAVTLEPGLPITTVISPSRQGLCFGDSGGPAFASIAGQNAQVGVLSNGDPSCEGGDTYVSVPAFEAWIHETAEELGHPIEDA